MKAKNFSHSPGKLGKVRYILTPKGIQDKINLTYHFLKKKEAEYNQIKKEWEETLNNNKKSSEKSEAFI